MLGTHNSCSGYKVVSPWYTKGIPNLWSKCQSLTLEDQWDLGVRLFDFRIRTNKSGAVIVCHGLSEYDITFSEALIKILTLQSNCGRGELEPVYIWCAWDHTVDRDDKDKVIETYKLMLEGFPSLRFTGLYERGTKNLLCSGYHSSPTVREMHGSIDGNWKYVPPIIWSMLYNSKEYTEYADYIDSDTKYLVLDFIEKG